MNVERIIVETNDETGNNPVEYDWSPTRTACPA